MNLAHVFSRVLVAGAFALGLAAIAQPSAGAETSSVTLVYHGSVQGEITDCGCKRKPMGGLARRAELIDEIRTNDDVLLVDCGGIIGRHEAAWQAQSEYLCQETAKLGYDCLGVGVSDFNYGVEFLKSVTQENGLVMTSANVRDAATGELMFHPYRIVEKDGARFGLISVLDPSLQPQDMDGPVEGIQIDSPEEALNRYLPELREKSDVVILLANLAPNSTRSLLIAMGDESGIDVAVEGHVGRRYARAQRVGAILLLAANNRGKYLGQCDMIVQEGVVADATVKVHELILTLPEDPTIADRVKQFQKDQEALAQDS